MLLALRVVAVLQAISMFLQPVLAGMFLSGQDGMIDVHAANGMIVAVFCLVQTVIAFMLRRGRRIERRIFPTSSALFLLEVLQITVGFQHSLWIHIPLGTMVMAATAVLMTRIMAPQGTAAVGTAGAATGAPVAVPAGIDAEVPE
jgi:hypothetical protein